MKRLFVFLTCISAVLSLAAQGRYQFADPGFEQYTKDGEPGNGWYSFASASGSKSGYKNYSPYPSSVAGCNSNHAVQIYSKYAGLKVLGKEIFGANANGNLTTGCINMGSTTPEDADNYNYTNSTGDDHKYLFAGRPDGVCFDAKFTSGGSPNGRFQFILHDDCSYRDPELDDMLANRIGKCAVLIPESSDWVHYTGTFAYDKKQTSTQYLLASATTNPTPGGSQNDYLTLDNIYFIYNSELATFVYDGSNLIGAGKYAYDLSDQQYVPSKLTEYTSNGVAATISEPVFDESTGILTITVYGNDFGDDTSIGQDPTNFHTYTFQFASLVSTKTFTEDLIVDIDGASTPAIPTSFYVDKFSNGTYRFRLYNFSLGEGDDAFSVGNIIVPNVPGTAKSGVMEIATEQTIQISEGDDPNVSFWLGPILGDVPINLNGAFSDEHMYCTISIYMEDLKQNIFVTLGERDAVYPINVTVSAAEYATMYYSKYPLLMQGVVQGYVMTLDGDKLTATAKYANGDAIPAGECLILNGPQDTYTFQHVQASEVSKVPVTESEQILFGTDAKEEISIEEGYKYYYLANGSKGIGFYQTAEDGAETFTNGAHKCYLRLPAASPAAAVREYVFAELFGEEVTGLTHAATPAEGAATEVYAIDGRRVKAATAKGLYIKDGKKVIVR